MYSEQHKIYKPFRLSIAWTVDQVCRKKNKHSVILIFQMGGGVKCTKLHKQNCYSCRFWQVFFPTHFQTENFFYFGSRSSYSYKSYFFLKTNQLFKVLQEPQKNIGFTPQGLILSSSDSFKNAQAWSHPVKQRNLAHKVNTIEKHSAIQGVLAVVNSALVARGCACWTYSLSRRTEQFSPRLELPCQHHQVFFICTFGLH